VDSYVYRNEYWRVGQFNSTSQFLANVSNYGFQVVEKIIKKGEISKFETDNLTLFDKEKWP
jgi:hypothetical protein